MYDMEIIKIGDQQWSSKNLDVDSFKNGEMIPECKSDDEWKDRGENGSPAWCYFDNDQMNGEKYGKLYNWYAVNDQRGLAPIGWHIPTRDEWLELDGILGEEVAGIKVKSTTGWNDDGNGTNESGFNGLPGAFRMAFGQFGDDYTSVGDIGCWYSSTEKLKENGDSTIMAYQIDLSKEKTNLGMIDDYKYNGCYVRCIKD